MKLKLNSHFHSVLPVFRNGNQSQILVWGKKKRKVDGQNSLLGIFQMIRIPSNFFPFECCVWKSYQFEKVVFNELLRKVFCLILFVNLMYTSYPYNINSLSKSLQLMNNIYLSLTTFSIFLHFVLWLRTFVQF